jgi:ankyrin repeat protein
LVKELGADVNQGNDKGVTPISIAAENGQLAIVRFLAKDFGADVDLAMKISRSTPSCVNAEKGNADMLRLLCKDLGANVDQIMKFRKSPSIIAAKHGHLEAVVCLISELGADLNHPDEDGRTVLEYARSAGHKSIVAAIKAAAQAKLEISTKARVGRRLRQSQALEQPG